MIKHATVNGAALLGMGDRLGRVRQGYLGRPARRERQPAREPAPAEPDRGRHERERRNVRGGGVEWTIKDGMPYHGPTLMREVKDMVAKARAERGKSPTAAGAD